MSFIHTYPSSQMPPQSPLQILVVGAGLGGLSAAISISRSSNRKIIVIERSPQLGETGAGIQAPPNFSRILDRWGLLQALSAQAAHPESIITRSALDDSILCEMQLKGEMEEKYGAPWLHISRTTLHKTLVDEAVRLGVVFRLGCNVVGIDSTNPKHPAVKIHDGEDIVGDIIIGADGVNSVCRSSLLGYPDPAVRSGDMVYRLTLPSSLLKTHHEVIIRELATKTNFNYWAGPNGHAVGYLIEGGEKFNIVISASDNLPEGFEKGKGDIGELRERFKGWRGKSFAGLMEMVGEVSVWRLCCGRELESWSRGRVALVGDASHAMLPYLAQGAAQALEDGAVLGAVLSKCENEDEILDAMAVYEELRIPRAKKIARLSGERRGMMLGGEGRGFRSPWGGDAFQKEIFGYDVEDEVETGWGKYKAGKTGFAVHSASS